MVTRLLVECGMYVGDEADLLPPSAEDNREGYWEHQGIVEINAAILHAFGGSWQNPPVFPEGWASSEALSGLRLRAKATIEALSRQPFWGWKDPRTCLTLEFWRQIVPDLVVVLSVRHPIEVAQSLASRREGYASRPQGLALWHEYYSRAYESLESTPRVVSHYISYFYDAEAELARVLRLVNPQVSAEEIATATKTVNRDLWRGFRIDEAQLEREASPEVLSLYNRMRAEGGEVLDRLRSDAEFQDHLTRIALQKSMQKIDRLERLSLERADEIARLQGMLEEVLHVKRLFSRGLTPKERVAESRWILGRLKVRLLRALQVGGRQRRPSKVVCNRPTVR